MGGGLAPVAPSIYHPEIYVWGGLAPVAPLSTTLKSMYVRTALNKFIKFSFIF